MEVGGMWLRWVVGLVGLAVLGGLSARPATAEGPAAEAGDGRPYPRVEAGGHTAMIRRIAVDREGRWLVSASDDKSARVWSLADGRLERVLRPPVGEKNEGKLYAVALSPDGATVALGGWTNQGIPFRHNIYLFDRASGRLTRRLGGLPNVVLHLAFSADGRHLAATLGGSNGVWVWETRGWQSVLEDRDYGDASYWAEFDPRGRLVTSCWDGKLRLYGPEFEKRAERQAPGGQRPYAAAFSPDGRRIAVGYDDTTAVDLLDGDDLAPRSRADTSGVDNGDLSKVAWSRDGRHLYAAGSYQDGGNYLIRRWDDGGRGGWREWPAADNTVMDLRPLPDGALAYGTADPALGVFAASGEWRWQLTPALADLRGAFLGRFHLSADAATLEFGLAQGGRDPLRFTLGQGLAEAADPPSPTLTAPRTEAPGLAVRGWRNEYTPTLDGRPLPLKEYERSRSLAIAPDGRHFLLGSEWTLRHFDPQGTPLWSRPVPGAAWAVNVAGDGRTAVAGLGDGTLRWYRLSDGRELLALLVHRQSREWVAWTPEGFFDASPGGEALFGYQLNHGPDREGEFIEVAQLREQFYRPDLVAGRLGGNDEAIRQALAGIGDVRQVLARGLPPLLAWESEMEPLVEERQQMLRVLVEERGGGVGRVEYRINGVLMQQAKGRFHGVQGPEGRRLFQQPVSLDDGDNRVEVTIYSRNGELAAKPLTWRVTVRDPLARPATLHVLAVGSDRYRGLAPERVLDFAASDAVRVAEALRRGGEGLFAERHVVTLVNARATLGNITRALEEMAGQVRPNDVFVLYLAGHAEGDGRNYYYLPWDFAWTGREALERESLDSGRLTGLLSRIDSRKSLLVLDTCNAGDMILASAGIGAKYRSDLDTAAVDRLMRKTGRAVLAATRSGQPALEGIDGSGAYTGELIRGLEGAAERVADGVVTVSELADHLERELPRVTKRRLGYEQIPMKQLTGDSFAVSRAGGGR